jgi:hypothetical protein
MCHLIWMSFQFRLAGVLYKTNFLTILRFVAVKSVLVLRLFCSILTELNLSVILTHN